MFQNTPITHSIDYHGQQLSLQTGLLARQATGSVVATLGQTTVLAAVVVGGETQADYFPLQVVYEERLYAAGKIKGSRFIKREGRPSDVAVLAGRMVDRSLRSLFNPYTRNEIQVIITVLSIDEVNSPDTLAVLAASSALRLCGIDGYNSQVAAVRVGLRENNYIVNPNYEDQEKGGLDLVISGDGTNIMMVETAAHLLPEEMVAGGFDVAIEDLKMLNTFQNDFVTKAGSTKNTAIISKNPSPYLLEYWKQFQTELEKVMYVGPVKLDHDEHYNAYIQSHYSNLESLQTMVQREGVRTPEDLLDIIDESGKAEVNGVEVNYNFTQSQLILKGITQLSSLKTIKPDLQNALHEALTLIVRENVLKHKKRVDGRALDETRKITPQVAVLPHNHGSSLFDRGETQVLNVLTIGTNRDAQTLDDMEDFEEQTKRYIHHYNFPAYSVGETGRYFGPGRREIGHGALAEKALLPVLPSEDEFPYTVRLVSECLGSNGSTSMAATCGSSLSLMDAGVPIKALVAGVAMGLMLDVQTNEYEVLTDIQGFEDHHGDMDFKITGTREGITAIQLDNKVSGLTVDILKDALFRSKHGRMHILDIMESVISRPRDDISQHAPRVAQTDVPYEKIGDVIGPSGKIIKSIIARTGVEIEIDDLTGKTVIYGKTQAQVEEAKTIVEGIIKDYLPGEVVQVEVYRLETFGAFVKIVGSEKEGLIHISEASVDGGRTDKIGDVFDVGKTYTATIIEINDRGQIRFTMKNGSTPEKKDRPQGGGGSFEIVS
jgi:polyribonucleotide nucleotidyltransferase